MVLEFLHLFGYLNFLYLSLKKRQQVIKKAYPTHIKTIKIFKQKKNNNGYWNRAKLYQQIINKALLNVKVFYLGYLLILFLDNVINYFVYTKNILQMKNINKDIGAQ